MNSQDIRPSGDFRVNLHGIIDGEVAAGETKQFDWIVDNDYVMNGADYEASGNCFGNRITLEIVHPSFGVVLTPANRIYVRKIYYKELYGADLFAGLTVRVIYENNSASTVNFNFNLDLHTRQD